MSRVLLFLTFVFFLVLPPSGWAASLATAHRDGGGAYTAILDGGMSVLVMLPKGTEHAEIIAVDALIGSEPQRLAADAVQVGKIMSLRGVPVMPVTYLREDSPEKLKIHLEADGDPQTEGARPFAPGQNRSAVPSHQGVYLIITTNTYLNALEPLIEWKITAGYDVHVRTTAEIGDTREEILAFIQEAYDTWPEPPLYLFLVGDVEDVPTWDVNANVSDHPYACLDGDDFLPDLLVGRITAHSPAEVEVQVAKIIHYESTPDLAGGDPWFSRALLVAGDYGSSTPRATSRWIGEELLEIGYTDAWDVFYPPIFQGEPHIRSAIDLGVSIINYRGWAYGDIGWEPPRYTVDDIPNLQNGWKLPFIWSIVCHTGNFGNPFIDCFGEAWLKAGTPTESKGAIGFIGTGEHWVHSRWNDRLDIELTSAVCHEDLRRFGEILALAKVALIPQFPSEIEMWDPYGGLIEESVEYYAHVYNLLGDPSLALWTTTPREVLVNCPTSLPASANFTEIRVTEDDGTTPVAGARVCLVQEGIRVGYAVTEEDGWAVPALALESLEPLLVTVTGEALYPQQETIPITEPSLAVTCAGAAITSGAPLPGTSISLRLALENTGTAMISGAAAKIEMPAGIPPAPQKVALPTLAPGDQGETNEITVALDADLEDGRRLCFIMTPTIPGTGMLDPSEACFTVTAPRITSTEPNVQVDLAPGQGGDLVLTLTNSGAVAAGEISAELSTVTPGIITLIDPNAVFPEILPGETGANAGDPFMIEIAPGSAIGSVVPMCMAIEHADGPRATVTFNLVIGAAQACDPIGPDAYGYYCYDNADLHYPGQAPVYDWIECSPLYGGTGTFLDEIRDNYQGQIVELPFTFTYYGVDYDSIRASDNGWISFDTTFWYDIRNWRLPDRWGRPCQVGVFWDNLDPMKPESDGVYAWHDDVNGRFVIEWSHLQNWEDFANNWQTFEVVLNDPAIYPTPTGDGELLFQYKQIVNDDYMTMYSTVGIEDQSQDVGILYTYCNEYEPGASALAPELAILFTTEPPEYVGDRADRPLSTAATRPFLRLVEGSITTGPCHIHYSTGGHELLELAIYDAIGRRVSELRPHAHDGAVTWGGRGQAAGTYWVRMRLKSGEETRKFIHLR